MIRFHDRDGEDKTFTSRFSHSFQITIGNRCIWRGLFLECGLLDSLESNAQSLSGGSD